MRNRRLPVRDAMMMSNANFFFSKIQNHGEKIALFENGVSITYSELMSRVANYYESLDASGIKPGDVVVLVGRFSAADLSIFLALIKCKAIIVLIDRDEKNQAQLISLAKASYLIAPGNSDHNLVIERVESNATIRPALYEEIKKSKSAGLVIFSSGTTGNPKIIVHSMEKILAKFQSPSKSLRTVLFLKFDHFGGVNTVLHTFSNGGLGICLENMRVDYVCKTIINAGAELLPTTPTYLNMLLSNPDFSEGKLKSLKVITYGAEPMTEYTLSKIAQKFPNVKLKQTYGLSELGVMHTKSKNISSLWLKVGGEGFQTKIVDDVLYIKSISSMIGYLNEISPFDKDGWMCTGDVVEKDADGYIKILGRNSDMINVGGLKVFPTEVENLLGKDPGVSEVAVYGRSHPVLGSCVAVKLVIKNDHNFSDVKARLNKLCLEKLDKFKVPMTYIQVSQDELINNRSKKLRK